MLDCHFPPSISMIFFLTVFVIFLTYVLVFFLICIIEFFSLEILSFFLHELKFYCNVYYFLTQACNIFACLYQEKVPLLKMNQE